MDKKQKMILFVAIGVGVALIAMVIFLIVGNSKSNSEMERMQAQLDSVQFANDQLQIANLTHSLDSLPSQLDFAEGKNVSLGNDSIVAKYNEARNKIEGLLKELNAEKKSNSRNREKIKQLEGQISSLKNYCKDLLSRIAALNEENEGLRQENAQVKQQNEQLASQVSSATAQNEELSQKVQLAEKLNVTGVSLNAYNKKGKNEKKIHKAKSLGVSFTISPNNTARPGLKDIYVRITSPEGNLLKGNGSFEFDGAMIEYTAKRQVEYANEELAATIYWDVNTSLTKGEYTVEIFCDGNRLATRKFVKDK